MNAARYAVYFAPAPDSALWRFAASWLGRDAVTGSSVPQLVVPGFSPERFRSATESPRLYGFHATLKPPFRLAKGRDPDSLRAAVENLAAKTAPFSIRLQPAVLDRFLVLTTPTPDPRVHDLADRCVRELDRFRALASAEELSRRRAAGLTERQEGNLERWGYPYVFADYRFHMTLTERLPDDELGVVQRYLQDALAPINESVVPVDSLAIFFQSAPGTPFLMTQRVPLRGGDHAERSAATS